MKTSSTSRATANQQIRTISVPGGYKEEGTITTPFDMCGLNDLDRFHLVGDVIDRAPGLAARAAYAKQSLRDKLIEHKHYICERGEDLPEVHNWKWKPT